MSALVLPFELERQQGGMLCWAAVTVALKRFYDPAAVLSQVDLARAVLGESYDHCCSTVQAMREAGLYYQEKEGVLSAAAIRARLAQGDPVLATMRYFVGWHLVVVHGIDDDDRLHVADPGHGPARCAYDDFVTAYRQHHQWTHYYDPQPTACA